MGLLPPDTVPYATPPEKLAARARYLASPPTSPLARLARALLALAVAVPVWLLLVAETLRRAWDKGSLYAALAPPRDPDALEQKAAPWPFRVREFSVAVEGGRVRLGCVELVPEKEEGEKKQGAEKQDEAEAGEEAAGAGGASDGDGTPKRPLALFLHGFPENAFSWRLVMPAVAAKGYRCVALSLRGYHGSDAPEGVWPYRLRRLADDVRDAALALGPAEESSGGNGGGVTLIAHDWGGSVAWAAAALHGSLIKRMVVLALPPLALFGANLTPRQVLRSLYILRFQVPWLPEASLLADDAKVVGLCFTQPPIGCETARLSEEEVAVFRHAFLQPGRATCALNYYRALARSSLAPAPVPVLSRLLRDYRDDALAEALRRPLADLPVLIVHAAQDVALGTQLMDGWEAVCPHADSRGYLMGRCSHWVNQDRPDAVNELLEGWLPAAAK